PVPKGAVGELYIGGDGLARGYLHRPDLTAERFVPHPYVRTGRPPVRPGARLYRTGDLVRYQTTGALEYLGRMDRQVKIRGFRIELGEMEARLRQHPAVREAVVIVREDRPDDPYLVAYIVLDLLRTHEAIQEEQIRLAQVRTSLQEQLPNYMVPTSFVV